MLCFCLHSISAREPVPIKVAVNRCFITKDVDYCCHGRSGFVQMLSSLMHFFSPECCIDSLKIPTLCLDCSCLIILLKLRVHVVGSLQQHPFSNTALQIFSRSFMGFIKKKILNEMHASYQLLGEFPNCI